MNVKYYIFSIFIVICTFCCLCIDTKALSYTANNNESYTVDSVQSLRDYYYFTNVDSNNISTFNFSVFQSSVDSKYYCIMNNNTSLSFRKTSSYFGFSSGCATSFTSANTSCYDSSDDFNIVDRTSVSGVVGGNRLDVSSFNLVYNSKDLYSCVDSSITQNANFTYQEIDDYYINLEPSPDPSPEPSPEPDGGEYTMFDVVETFLIQFINILPFIIPFILVMNLACRILFNERS